MENCVKVYNRKFRHFFTVLVLAKIRKITYFLVGISIYNDLFQRERSHITSSAEGGGGFQKMTLDDGGGGGGWGYGQMTSSKIAQFRDFYILKSY